MKKLLLYSIIISGLLCACNKDKDYSDNKYAYEEEVSNTVNLTGQTLLSLENTNGNIIITGSDAASSIYFTIKKKVKSPVSVMEV